mgnify:CR=1 FL=1
MCSPGRCHAVKSFCKFERKDVLIFNIRLSLSKPVQSASIFFTSTHFPMKVHLLFPSSRFFNFTIKLFFTLAMIIIAPPLCVLAQSLEEAYDPCATEPDSLPENTDFLLCPEPCSEGYCFEDPEDNEGIPTNGLVEDKWIEISGVYRITRNAEFRNCYFKMLPGAQILIEPAHEANPEIAFKNCEFWGCIEMWYGTVSYTHLTLPTNREV